MLILNKHTASQRYAASRYYWGQLADWIARHDRHVPVYHQLCIRLWLWAFGLSVAR
jgi:hypothetical protein